MLLEGTDSTGVTIVGGEYIRFKRKTDFVVCPECLSVYKAGDLLASEDFEEEEPTPAEKLERLVESELDAGPDAAP